LTNLIGNAIKFSPPNTTVSIEVTEIDPILDRATKFDSVRADPATRSRRVRFAIADCGRGIPADKLETIFNRFQQVDSSDSRDKGGTGLGLAICKSIVEQHQGQIWVESDWGRSSTFFFTLPQPMNKNLLPQGTL
ncbi:ATP-binding protein, partial [Chamaesiphon sp. VAR_48_metabat_403]|uniref:sensor histidine kinase n=1 Tax=Chamaesiphon sp. VAR_48_metabat_403 TaxID=2964700 RepID=UPI00286DBB74